MPCLLVEFKRPPCKTEKCFYFFGSEYKAVGAITENVVINDADSFDSNGILTTKKNTEIIADIPPDLK